MALALGTRLGPHETEAAVGTGGTGEVYRARDTRFDRTVAINTLPNTTSSQRTSFLTIKPWRSRPSRRCVGPRSTLHRRTCRTLVSLLAVFPGLDQALRGQFDGNILIGAT